MLGAALPVVAGGGPGVVAGTLVAFELAVGGGLLPVVFDDSFTQAAPTRRIRTETATLIDRRVFICLVPRISSKLVGSGATVEVRTARYTLWNAPSVPLPVAGSRSHINVVYNAVDRVYIQSKLFGSLLEVLIRDFAAQRCDPT